MNTDHPKLSFENGRNSKRPKVNGDTPGLDPQPLNTSAVVTAHPGGGGHNLEDRANQMGRMY